MVFPDIKISTQHYPALYSSSAKPGTPARRTINRCVATVEDRTRRVDPELHDRRLVSLLAVPLHWDFFGYIVDYLVKASLVWSAAPSQYHSIAQPTEDALKTAALFDFVKRLVVASRVNTAAVLVALVYVDRWSHSSVADVPQLSCEQVFLAALFLATKYMTESSYYLKYWKVWSAMSRAEIRWAERKFLKAIDFEVGIQEEHLLVHYDEVMKRCVINNERILPPLPQIPRNLVRRRAHAVRRVVAPAPAFIPFFPVQASPVSPAFGVLRKEVDWNNPGPLGVGYAHLWVRTSGNCMRRFTTEPFAVEARVRLRIAEPDRGGTVEL
ncbi:hypothetical protein BKA93DRAFT_868905 [Sparassis latifolia]